MGLVAWLSLWSLTWTFLMVMIVIVVIAIGVTMMVVVYRDRGHDECRGHGGSHYDSGGRWWLS